MPAARENKACICLCDKKTWGNLDCPDVWGYNREYNWKLCNMCKLHNLGGCQKCISVRLAYIDIYYIEYFQFKNLSFLFNEIQAARAKF